jgi:hypothetical protein
VTGSDGDEHGPSPDGVLAREDEDDHDLLTYGEVGARVSEELAAQRDRIDALERRAAAGEHVDDALSAARRRLALLSDAAARNSRQPINDENFERFFGYKGQARRNT